MSHFTVLVIGSDIDAALAPFQENNMGDCPRQYLEFNDTEGEMLEEYETGTATRGVMPDGSYKSPYDEVFRKKDETCFTGSTSDSRTPSTRSTQTRRNSMKTWRVSAPSAGL